MPDGNPIASLYPQPPAPSQPTNALATYGTMLQMRGQQIQNARAQFELAAGQNQYLNNALGTLADKPDVSMNDVNSMIADVARNTAIDSDTLAAVPQSLPSGGPALQSALRTLANASIGSAGLAARVQGPLSPTGQPTATSLGQASYSPTYATGNAPGVEAAANTAGTGSANQGLALSSAADGVTTRKAMLGNLQTDLQNFTAGPGSDWTNVAKAWANRTILPQGFQFDPRSIASQEQFNKVATQLAQQQFATLGGTGANYQLDSAIKSNPSGALSNMGNQGIIAMLSGNEDAIAAKNRAWQQWQARNGAGSFGAFSSNFNASFDPRVYQAQYLSRSNFVQMMKSMSPADQARFRSNLAIANQSGYASSPGTYYGGQ